MSEILLALSMPHRGVTLVSILHLTDFLTKFSPAGAHAKLGFCGLEADPCR